MPFTVTYNGNGSDGGNLPVDPQGSYNNGDPVTVQGYGSMTKTGATFAYWNTKADGSGTFHGWPADTSFPMPAANVVLYAQWFVTTGLNNGGKTAHDVYAFAYDSSLQAGGLEPGRTQALINAAEADFGIMSGWFAGITPNGPSPIPVYVTRLNGGANNTGSIRLNPNTNDPNELRSLLVSEITESFMAGQNKGWGFLPGVNNEESCGEGLSLFLTQQFELSQGIVGPYTAFTANNWLNSSRFDYVNSVLPFPGNGPGTGCSILFIYYLFQQLGFTIPQIIAAAPGYKNGVLNAIAPLRGVYQNLTKDNSDPFPFFKQLLDSFFPGTTIISGPNPDNPFPLTPFRQSTGSSFSLSREPKAVEVFWIRPDGMVFTNARDPSFNNGNWNNPNPIAANPGSADPRSGIAAVFLHLPKIVEVFWVRPDGMVFTNARDPNFNNGNWNNPIPIAANPGSAAIRDV